ncbi:MAG TPA: hypothetical protein C5S50_10815 [Methanosarcinaceae archaeon]|nr:hypothetical protein [Methanosarcinaceae archaeon]
MILNKSVTISMLLLIFMLIQPSAAETEWIDHGEKTLYWGETTNITGYMVKAVDFTPSRHFDVDHDWVLLGVYKDGVNLDGAKLSSNNSRINDTAILCKDKIKIVVKDISTGYNIPSPYVVIQVYLLKEEIIPSISPEQWINNTLEFSKCVLKEIYIGDWINVELRMVNLKDIDLDIAINDSIPPGFEVVPDPEKHLMWNLSLPEKESTDVCQYSIRATRPGTFTLPAARAVVEYHGATYTIITGTSEIIAHGPDINLTKTATMLENNTISVIVSVRNIGDRATYVRIIDEIPVDAELVCGDLDLEFVAQPDKTYSNNYSIKTSNVGLPPVAVIYKDNKKRIHEVNSGMVTITVQTSPSPDILPTAISNDTQNVTALQSSNNDSIREKLASMFQHFMQIFKK